MAFNIGNPNQQPVNALADLAKNMRFNESLRNQRHENAINRQLTQANMLQRIADNNRTFDRNVLTTDRAFKLKENEINRKLELAELAKPQKLIDAALKRNKLKSDIAKNEQALTPKFNENVVGGTITRHLKPGENIPKVQSLKQQINIATEKRNAALNIPGVVEDADGNLIHTDKNNVVSKLFYNEAKGKFELVEE